MLEGDERGEVSFKDITCNPVLWSVQYNMQEKGKTWVKYICYYIFHQRAWSSPSVCTVSCGLREGSFVEGLVALR